MSKMLRFLSVLTVALMLVACSEGIDSTTIPDSVFSKEKMAKVLMDVNLLEASLNVNTFNPKQIAPNGGIAIITEDVLKKHQITKAQYDDSFQFYSNHPKLLAEVYQLVLNDLSKMQAEVTNGK